ncbi:MAG TPA: CAP domain-containing protein [Allosphingosinicella sp.]|jgi:hypothetical protein
MGEGLHRLGRIAAVAALCAAAPVLIGSTGRLTSLDERLLAAHNRERTGAGLPAMRWDASLAADAAEWGEELAAVDDIEHSPDDPEDPEPQGENLWLGTSGYFTPEQMVGMWAEEKRHFVPRPIPYSSRTGNFDDVGHYTQLMWRETGKVGCALAKGQENEILVCRYSAAGNVEGEQAF